jgi:hypothetical protein
MTYKYNAKEKAKEKFQNDSMSLNKNECLQN